VQELPSKSLENKDNEENGTQVLMNPHIPMLEIRSLRKPNRDKAHLTTIILSHFHRIRLDFD